jgi:MoaA/NifB/PqqE/SkfB family radical SAM enzyme
MRCKNFSGDILVFWVSGIAAVWNLGDLGGDWMMWDFAKRYVGESLLKTVFNYVEGDPNNNIPRLLSVLEKITPLPEHKEYIRYVLTTYQNNPAMRTYFNNIFTEIDHGVRERLLCNAVINTMLLSHPRRREVEEKTGVHVPYTILIDPTSACNLKCEGCWAGEYNKHDQLEPELMDRILNEARELGIYGIVLSGGEPFVYPYLLDMAQKHNDMAFMVYTNGTKIDEEVADRLQELGNISPAVSLEGWEEATDARRGKSTFKKLTRAMDLMKERGIIFGASFTITRDNIKQITSDNFIDFLIDKGVRYIWSFHYIPIGREPDPDLMVLPEQRAYLLERIKYLRENKPILIVDFWNDGKWTNGCIAGGDAYFHINARGDVEPCAFVHFAVDNIREKSLLDVLKNPLFLEYQKRMPFYDNYLCPCPIIDNPQALREMVEVSGAHPTHVGAETVLYGDIAAFLDERSAKWKEVANPIWESINQKEKSAS